MQCSHATVITCACAGVHPCMHAFVCVPKWASLRMALKIACVYDEPGKW